MVGAWGKVLKGEREQFI